MRTQYDAETQIEKYFSGINDYVQRINEGDNSSEGLWDRVLLEDYIKSNLDEDMKTHPYFLLCDSFKEKALTQINEYKENNGDTYKNDIRQEIVWVHYKNYSRFQVHFDMTDYIAALDIDDASFNTNICIPFKEYGSLTEIQDYRLLEKIENISNVRKLRGRVKIAHFGTLKRTDSFDDFFESKGVNIEFDEYRYIGKSVFECKKEHKRISVKNMSDLCWLVQEYDMTLFLNESYFYKKRQSDITSVEQNAKLFVDWYWKRYKYFKKNDFSLDAIMCLFGMYNKVLQFQRNFGETLSGEYEFNAKLLNNLEMVSEHVKNCGDVYLYMKNDRVANQNIDERDVCKEEYYDGQNLYVYKIPSHEKQNVDTIDCADDGSVASVDVWKIIKSISNRYYEKYWKNKYCISQLKSTRIKFVGGSQRDKDTFGVYYQYSVDIKDDIKTFVEEIFELASSRDHLEFVQKYIKDMIYGAVLAHAVSVEGLVLSNKIHTSKSVYFEEKTSGDEKKIGTKMSTYSARKAYYNIIDRLNYLRINDFAQAKKILQYDFKPYIAKDLTDDEFEKFMREINGVCKKYGDTESRIFYYTDVFC